MIDHQNDFLVIAPTIFLEITQLETCNGCLMLTELGWVADFTLHSATPRPAESMSIRCGQSSLGCTMEVLFHAKNETVHMVRRHSFGFLTLVCFAVEIFTLKA